VNDGSDGRRCGAENTLSHPLLDCNNVSVRELFSGIRGANGYTNICECPERKLLGAKIAMEESYGDGVWELLQIGDLIFVVITDVTHRSSTPKSALSDGLVCFHVRLSGEVTLAINQERSVRVGGPSLLLWHQTPGLYSSEQELAGRRVLSVTLFCDPVFLAEGRIGPITGLPSNLNRYVESGYGINYRHLPITSEILNTATSIVESSFTGRLRLIHLEAKTLELYCLIAAALDRLADLRNEQYSEADLNRLHQARKILATRFSPTPRIAQIAREVGINQTKLKRGFKALFGKPMYEFGQDCRMQYALSLLRDRHMTVNHVTDAIGYRHQTTFAAAFKEHFGYRPKDVRRAYSVLRQSTSRVGPGPTSDFSTGSE
jgi:AraC-like DNA-binding protein